MAFEDRTCWLIRAGERARYAGDFVKRRQVSFAWDWPDIGDLSSAQDAEVYLALEAAGHAKPADDLRDVRIFTNRMAVGDLIVVPDTAVRDLLFGQVKGDYVHAADDHPHAHARKVRWFGRLATSVAPDLLVGHTTNIRHTVRRLPEQLHWQRLAGEVDDFLGRPVKDVPRQVARAASVRRTGTTRVKAPTTPQFTPTPDLLCAGCGLLRNPALFLGGSDYCRDCD